MSEQEKMKQIKKQYNKTFYEKHKERLIADSCQRVECPLCCKMVTKKGLKNHKETKLCKKIRTKNKYEEWLKNEESLFNDVKNHKDNNKIQEINTEQLLNILLNNIIP